MSATSTSHCRASHFLILAGLTSLLSACSLAVASGVGNVNATPETHYMLADIPKPTYTPTPEPTPSPTPTVASPIEMTIVDTASAGENINAAGKYILVDISEQQMYVYENGTLLYNFIVSTGIHNATRTGLFHVQSKIPNAYGATWNIWMPNWLGIYYAGGLENGIHSLPILPNGAELWAGYLGRPISYGCVVLGDYESSILYNWAELGTPVEIRW